MIRFRPRSKTLSRWLDGDLPEPQARRLEQTLRQNDSLNRTVEWFDRMGILMEPPRPIRADFTERLIAALPPMTRRAPSSLCGVVETVNGGGATVHAPENDDTLDALPDMALCREETVELDDDTRLLIALPDGSRLYLNRGARVQLHPPRAGLALHIGECFATMKPQPAPFEIKTPAALLTVLGTKFDAEVPNESQTRLTVLRGKVSFKNKAGQATVTRGQEVEAPSNGLPQPRPADTPRKRIAWTENLERERSSIMKTFRLWIAIAVIGIGVATWFACRTRAAQDTEPVQPGKTAVSSVVDAPALDIARPQLQQIMQWSSKASARIPDPLQSFVNNQVMVVNANGERSTLFVCSVRNPTGKVLTGTVSAGGWGYDPTLKLYDQSGAPLGLEWKGSKVPGNRSEQFITLNKPWGANDILTVIGTTKESPCPEFFQKQPNGTYKVHMQNEMIADGIQQFVLDLPGDFAVLDSPRIPADMKRVNGRLLVLYDMSRKAEDPPSVLNATIGPAGTPGYGTDSRSVPLDQLSQTVAAFRHNQAMLDDFPAFTNRRKQQATGGLKVNCQLYFIDDSGRLWVGSFLPPSLPPFIGSSPLVFTWPDGTVCHENIGYAPAPDDSQIMAAFGRLEMRLTNTPRSIKTYAFSKPAPGEYAFRMNSRPGAPVEESFCLYLPSTATLTQSSENPTETRTVGDKTVYVWTDRLTEDAPRHSVDVVVKIN